MPPSSPTRKRALKHAAMMPLDNPQVMGRPTLFKPEYNELVERWGKEGKSRAEMCSLLNIGRTTLNDWERQHSAFRESLSRAREHSQAWWERKAQQSLNKKAFQAQLWRYSMAGRFKEDYAEKAGSALADAMPDFLQAITDAANARRLAATKAQPGDDAQPIEPLDVVETKP